MFKLIEGGMERVCLIDDETQAISGTLRRTGDIVKRDEEGNLWYCGRTDNQVKRSGKRINLEQIEAVSSKVRFVN